MNDLGRALRILLDEWEEKPVGSIVIFFTGVVFIAFIVDTMLLYTYPAYTLIAIILLITNVAIKLYERYLTRKNYERLKNKHRL